MPQLRALAYAHLQWPLNILLRVKLSRPDSIIDLRLLILPPEDFFVVPVLLLLAAVHTTIKKELIIILDNLDLF